MQNGGRGNQQNPFDMLRNLGDLRDIKKLLGPDFFKNLPLSNGDGSSDAFESEDPYPPIDIYDSGNELLIWANMPGMNRSDISLQVGAFNLVIRGHVPSVIPKRDDRLIVDERFYGAFERDIELPSRVQTDSVRATYTNGVLRITLQKYAAHEDEFNKSVHIDFE